MNPDVMIPATYLQDTIHFMPNHHLPPCLKVVVQVVQANVLTGVETPRVRTVHPHILQLGWRGPAAAIGLDALVCRRGTCAV
jgi:hypothetical protein